jgi:hypothetical protein
MENEVRGRWRLLQLCHGPGLPGDGSRSGGRIGGAGGWPFNVFTTRFNPEGDLPRELAGFRPGNALNATCAYWLRPFLRAISGDPEKLLPGKWTTGTLKTPTPVRRSGAGFVESCGE